MDGITSISASNGMVSLISQACPSALDKLRSNKTTFTDLPSSTNAFAIAALRFPPTMPTLEGLILITIFHSNQLELSLRNSHCHFSCLLKSWVRDGSSAGSSPFQFRLIYLKCSISNAWPFRALQRFVNSLVNQKHSRQGFKVRTMPPLSPAVGMVSITILPAEIQLGDRFLHKPESRSKQHNFAASAGVPRSFNSVAVSVNVLESVRKLT